MGNSVRKRAIKNLSKNKRIRYTQKIMLISILIATFFALFGITSYLNFLYLTPKISDSMTYNQSGNVDYQVCLKQNDFLESNCINNKTKDSETSYVSALIDKIKINLKYQLTSSDLADYSYSYNVVATTKASEKGDTSKILYNKVETLKEGSYDFKNTNLITFNDDIDVDYQKYNEIIKEFKKNYVLSIDSNLTITFSMNISGKKQGIDKNITETHVATLVIPLAEQTANITFTDDKNLKEGNIITQEINRDGQFNSIELGVKIMYGIDSIFLIYLIYLIIKSRPSQKTYNGKISYILKNYDSYIVKSKELPPVEEMKIIEIDSFDDLIDVRNNLEKPIIFYESKHKDYSIFTIMTDQVAYIYILYLGDFR